MESTQANVNLKGSKFCGEFHAAGKFAGHIHKLKDGGYAVVEKADFSGKIIGSRPIDGRTLERFHTLNLGYSVVNYYRVRGDTESK